MNYPNLFIIGAPRAGTNTIVQLLKSHPQVFIPKKREIFFFSPKMHSGKFNDVIKPILSEIELIHLYQNFQGHCYFGDASTSYCWDPETPHLIKAKVQNPKFVFLVRDPAERLFSHYLLYKERYGEKRSFYKFIKDGISENAIPHDQHHIRSGYYASTVKNFYDHFNPNDFLILEFSKLKNEQNSIRKKLFEFLELEIPPIDGQQEKRNTNFQKKNKIIGAAYQFRNKIFPYALPLPKSLKIKVQEFAKPKISRKESDLIHEIYKNEIQEFKALTGISFHV